MKTRMLQRSLLVTFATVTNKNFCSIKKHFFHTMMNASRKDCPYGEQCLNLAAFSDVVIYDK